MQEGGAAAQVAEDEQRLFDGLVFVGGEEDVIQPEAEPVDEHAERPDQAEEGQKDDAFFGEAGGGVFGVEEGTVEGTPEKGEVIFHERVSILACDTCTEKAQRGFLGYSISKWDFWINEDVGIFCLSAMGNFGGKEFEGCVSIA
jgi:hypothetical protein